MSAPNFHAKNASAIFAIEEELSEDYESTEVADTKINVFDTLKAKHKYEDYERISESSLRSYPSELFAVKTIEFWGCWTINIYAVLCAGYYAGANLDWEIEVVKNLKNDYDVGDHRDFDLPYTISNRIDDEIIKLEKVFKEFTTPLKTLGTFSNGEAVYEKIKD